MTDEGTRLGRDLDAFRRHRSQAPGASVPELAAALAGLQGSDQPTVLFARLAEAAVPGVADGCRVELHDAAGDPGFRAEVGVADRGGSGPGQAVRVDLDALSVRVQGPARGPYPSYVGIVTFSWVGRGPTPTDRLLVDLLVRHCVAVVDLERLTLLLGTADDHAADAAVSAIATRSINVAVGIVMHQRGCTEDEAEELLCGVGSTPPRPLYETALMVIRNGQLPDRPPARHLRDVGSTPR